MLLFAFLFLLIKSIKHYCETSLQAFQNNGSLIRKKKRSPMFIAVLLIHTESRLIISFSLLTSCLYIKVVCASLRQRAQGHCYPLLPYLWIGLNIDCKQKYRLILFFFYLKKLMRSLSNLLQPWVCRSPVIFLICAKKVFNGEVSLLLIEVVLSPTTNDWQIKGCIRNYPLREFSQTWGLWMYPAFVSIISCRLTKKNSDYGLTEHILCLVLVKSA